MVFNTRPTFCYLSRRPCTTERANERASAIARASFFPLPLVPHIHVSSCHSPYRSLVLFSLTLPATITTITTTTKKRDAIGACRDASLSSLRLVASPFLLFFSDQVTTLWRETRIVRRVDTATKQRTGGVIAQQIERNGGKERKVWRPCRDRGRGRVPSTR